MNKEGRDLVTSAAGFMGSHLQRYLTEQGHEVLGLDNFTIGKNNGGLTARVDLLDKELVDNMISSYKPETVYHLAAWAHEGLSQFCPVRITENNYNAYLNVLSSSIRHGVRRIVVTSSMSVYGDQRPPFSEDLPRRPRDIYAVAKTAMEESTEILAKVFGFEYMIIRPHNVYGPGQIMHDPYRNVVGIFINRCLRNEPLYVYGDGEQKRAFSYIDDVTPSIAKAGSADIPSQIINVGPIEEISINELASEVLKHFPQSKGVIHLPDRPLEVKNAWCTNDKAKRWLGYQTSVPFTEGIKRMVKWAKVGGAREFKYLQDLELTNASTPKTWTDKL